MTVTPSVCVYCGCTCRLDYVVENGKIVKVLPNSSDDVSEGNPCIKGLTINEVVSEGRIARPMIRKNKNSPLEEVSWQEAFKFIYEKTKQLKPEDLFFAPSGKTTNEDNYIMQKFAKMAYKTSNIDSCCSRLCHAATVRVLKQTFGVTGTPWKMNDVYDTDCLIVIGSNPASNYPVFFNKILKAKKDGMKLVCIQPVSNLTSQHADLSLAVEPLTESVLLSGIIRELLETKKYDKKAEGVEGFSKLFDTVKKCKPEIVCKLCKIKREQYDKLMEMVSNAKSLGIAHGMGITQDVNATENICYLMNLIILKSGRLLSCRGEVNVQGAGDICNSEGKNILQALLLSPVRAAFISGFNPAQSLPNLDKVHENLKKIFLVQMDSYFNLTSEFADVILPTPILIERSGTVTNGERRVRLVNKVVQPFGESKPEWMIFRELSKLFNCSKQFDYENEREIFEEITKTIPDYSKINFSDVYSGNDAWADKKIRFSRINLVKFKKVKDIRSSKYPFILTTFRSQYQFLTGEMTSKSKTLSRFPDGPYCYVSEKDAKKLNISNDDEVKISSSTSSLTAKAKINNQVTEGVVGMHFHYEKLLVNKLFPNNFDKKSFTPNYKSVAVRIDKI